MMPPHSTVARLVLLTLLSVGLARADEPPLPEGWAIYPTPAPNACEWTRANLSKREWRVRVDNERLVIEPFTPKPRPADLPNFDISAQEPEIYRVRREGPCEDCVQRVDDGWIVGFNFGEWGGRLWWTDPDGNNSYPIAYAGRCKDIADAGPRGEEPSPQSEINIYNVFGVTYAGSETYVFTGYGHMGMNAGELLRMEKQDKWQACLVRDVEDPPQAMFADSPGSWLILTNGGLRPHEHGGALIRVGTDGSLQKLAQPAFLAMGALSPNSLVRLRDGTLYAGMRHFVGRLIPEGTGYREELLVPTGQPPFDFDPYIDAPGPNSRGVFRNCPRPNPH